MFKSNDKSFFMIRKIVNVVYFVLMCACVVAGIVIMASAKETYNTVYSTGTRINVETIIIGLLIMLLGPVFIQLGWLVTDAIFNMVLDVKIIRNATIGAETPKLPAPLFAKKTNGEICKVDVYEKLRAYKELCNEGVISQEEFEGIKNNLLKKNSTESEVFASDVEKIKKLKTHFDEGLLTEEEFEAEKSKILNK